MGSRKKSAEQAYMRVFSDSWAIVQYEAYQQENFKEHSRRIQKKELYMSIFHKQNGLNNAFGNKCALSNSLHTFSCRLPLLAAAVVEKKLTNAILPFEERPVWFRFPFCTHKLSCHSETAMWSAIV